MIKKPNDDGFETSAVRKVGLLTMVAVGVSGGFMAHTAFENVTAADQFNAGSCTQRLEQQKTCTPLQQAALSEVKRERAQAIGGAGMLFGGAFGGAGVMNWRRKTVKK